MGFTRVWENNSDTPLTASNLSKIVDYTSDGRILYYENEKTAGQFADYKLKLKANSRFSFSFPETLALFRFNESYVSHNGKTVPQIVENIPFTKRTRNNTGYSVSIEEETTNLLLNPGFENALNNWTTEFDNQGTTTSTITTSTDSFYSDNAASITIDAAGNRARLSQTIGLPDNTKPISFSFYYKGNANLKVIIVGNPNSGNKKYWNPGRGLWENVETFILVNSSIVSEYSLFTVQNIDVSFLEAVPEVQIIFYSDSPLTQYFIDAVQLEIKPFSTTFVDGTRGPSNFILPNSVVNLERGLIDVDFLPKYWNNSKNYLFVLKTSTNNDTICLYFDSVQYRLVFEIYDTTIASKRTAVIAYTDIQFTQLLNNWLRIICSWDTTTGIKLYIQKEGETKKTSFDSSSFTVEDKSVMDTFYIGSNQQIELAQGIINSLKFNSLPGFSDTKIDWFLANDVSADNTVYKVYESGEENQIIDESLLESGSFQSGVHYYVFGCDDGTELSDTATLVVSTSKNSLQNHNIEFCTLIGGFTVDSSLEIDPLSIWDISTRETETLHVGRLVVEDSPLERHIEFKSTIENNVAEIHSYVDSTYHSHIYGEGEFFDVDPSGTVKIDDLLFDDSTLSSSNTINLDSQGSVNIQSVTGIVVDNNIIKAAPGLGLRLEALSGQNIDIISGSGSVYIDNISFKLNRIFPKSGQNLHLENDGTSSTISLQSTGGSIELLSSDASISTTTGDVTINGLRIKDGHVSGEGSTTWYSDKPLSFTETSNQHIHLRSSDSHYGIGVQDNITYIRSGKNIAFYKGGTHSTTTANPGTGGKVLAAITEAENYDSVVDVSGYFFAGRVYNAVYNDLAECWEVATEHNLVYKKVAVQTRDGIRLARKRAEKGTVGIVSNSYGFILGSEGYNEQDTTNTKKLPIAISGRVEALYQGSLTIGDEVVSSKNGNVIKANFFEKIFLRDRIIGVVDSIKDETIAVIKI